MVLVVEAYARNMHGSRVGVDVAVVDLRSQVVGLSGSKADISSIFAITERATTE